MPHEATIRIFALGLLALAAVWFLAAAIGLRPAIGEHGTGSGPILKSFGPDRE